MNENKNQKVVPVPIGTQNFYTFGYQKYGVLGVGKNRYPILSMDQYIDHSMDEELHTECCIGLAQSSEYRLGMAHGPLPESEKVRIGADYSWTDMLRNIEQFDPDGRHRRAIDQIIATTPVDNLFSAVYRYVYFAMGAPIPWFFALYLKYSGFKDKATDGQWLPAATRFPKLLKYIETLPFKEIGRVLFFTTYPNAGVVMHRDSNVNEHKDHNINLFFTGGRPSYVWDDINNKKVYLDPTAKSYFFNNRDYHGVDPEPQFRYTLRIDGTFTDELQEKLGLVDGYTWKWDYDKE